MPLSSSDKILIHQALKASIKSHDPHRQVGVVIADSAGVVSDGTNRPPEAIGYDAAATLHSINQDPDSKYYLLEHAERNAIYSALTSGKSLTGTTMYGTLFPCADCARAIAAVGISRLVVPHPGSNVLRDQKWLDHYKYARLVLDRAGVEVSLYDPDDFEDGRTTLNEQAAVSSP